MFRNKTENQARAHKSFHPQWGPFLLKQDITEQEVLVL